MAWRPIDKSTAPARIPGGRELPRQSLAVAAGLICCLAIAPGCASQSSVRRTAAQPVGNAEQIEREPASLVSLAGYEDKQTEVKQDEPKSPADKERPLADDTTPPALGIEDAPQTLPLPAESLAQLETMALLLNPTLLRLSREVEAAEARSNFIDKLPDPTVGANVFGQPIETASGSQRANLSVKQLIPWLKRLDAQSQQAAFEALALQQVHEAERLRVLGDLRERWYRLYVLGKQIETNEANQQILKSLIEVANSRVATGKGSAGDVLLGALELGRLAEQLLTLEQQLASNKAELNRLVGREADHPVDIPNGLVVTLPSWSHSMLRQVANERQPAISAARLRTEATRWGIEAARLRRRPEVSLNATWFLTDNNRPATRIVDVGQDPWSIGAQVSVPLWRQKYDAIEQAAYSQHSAAQASVAATEQRYDSLLRDLWEQAKAAHETAELYESTILPTARQTLEADQKSYGSNAAGIEFDRVIADFRNVLTLELGYHRAIGQLAIVLARIRQAIGTDLAEPPTEPPTLPTPPAEAVPPAPIQ